MSQIYNYKKEHQAWGYAVSFLAVSEDDRNASILGYIRSRAIRRGDFLLFDHPSNSNCGVIYRVKSIEFQSDPRDMFFAEIEFYERTFPEQLRDAAAITRGDMVWSTDIPKEFKDLPAPYQ